jgi:long-chain fatty acid transport protein
MTTKHRTSCIALALAALPGLAFASGFGLIESNADGQGAAYAGSGAVAENASTIFFNPAGMTLLPGRQIVASVHAIRYSAKFNDGNPATSDGGDAGDLSLLPNLYYAMPLSANTWFGFGINVPFGLKTEYDPTWTGRVQGIKSEMKTVNLNPGIGMRLTEKLSVGIGVSAMYIEAELTGFAGAPGVLTVAGNDWGYGYNLGLLYEWDKDTRVGLSYRSKVKQKLEGNAQFSVLSSLDGPITASATLPDTATLSVYKRLDPQWAVLGDISWTGWSEFQELRILRDTGATLTVTPENWEDTLRFSLGAHYQLTGRTKLRMGVGYDESPVPSSQYRTARIPDSDRTWVAFGLGYRLNKDDSIDVAYSHLFVKDAPIDTPPGSYKAKVDILGVQYTHTF